jgi:cell division protein FtsW
LLGTLTVVGLFLVLAWRGYRVAMRAPDTFSALLAVGLTSMIVVQAAINIGVVTATLPVTGITLPFISYGGSSLVLSLAGVGLLLNISRYAR